MLRRCYYCKKGEVCREIWFELSIQCCKVETKRWLTAVPRETSVSDELSLWCCKILFWVKGNERKPRQLGDEKIQSKKLNMYLPPTLALTSNEPSHNLPALQIDKKGFSLNMLSMIDIIVKSWVGIDHQSTLHALSFLSQFIISIGTIVGNGESCRLSFVCD